MADQIVAEGGRAFAVAANVLSRESLQQAADRIHAELGPVDILINGAGGNKPDATATPDRSFFDIPAEAIQWVFNLNCLGTILPCQVFVPDMVAREQGVVINLASMSGIRPLTRVVAYSAAKAASPTSRSGWPCTWPRSTVREFASTPLLPVSSSPLRTSFS